MSTNQWTKVGEGMRRNTVSRTIYANFRHKGKTYRHSLKTEDKTTARNRLTDFRRDLEHGPIRNAENTIVSEVAPRFLASQSGMSKSDQTRSKGYMKFFVEEFGDTNPREIKPMDLEEWLQELREERDFAEDSWNKYAACFEKFFDFLILNSFASENPAKSLDFLKAKATRKYVPSTKEVQALLTDINNKTFFPEKKETLDFIAFMALTGQGKAEVVNFWRMDIDWKEEKLSFYRQKTRAIAHTMPMFPAIKKFLIQRLHGTKDEPTKPVFKIKSAKNALKSACDRLGLPRMGHHTFRRYFITQRLLEGVPPNIVAKWVGHKDSKMVMEIYSSIPNTFEVSFAKKIPAIKIGK